MPKSITGLRETMTRQEEACCRGRDGNTYYNEIVLATSALSLDDNYIAAVYVSITASSWLIERAKNLGRRHGVLMVGINPLNLDVPINPL